MGTDYLCKPNIVKLHYGGWLAVSDRTNPLRIGVIGVSEKEAIDRFTSSLKRWKEISEMDVIKDRLE